MALLMLAIHLHVLLVVARLVTIQNNIPRRDAANVLMDAHDGNIVQHLPGGPYYWYAMEYGNYSEPRGDDGCAVQKPWAAGFRPDHNISVWSSPDLVTWSLKEREALKIKDRPLGIYFRPKVVYNPRTRLYVLWVNYMEYPAPYRYGYGRCGREVGWDARLIERGHLVSRAVQAFVMHPQGVLKSKTVPQARLQSCPHPTDPNSSEEGTRDSLDASPTDPDRPRTPPGPLDSLLTLHPVELFRQALQHRPRGRHLSAILTEAPTPPHPRWPKFQPPQSEGAGRGLVPCWGPGNRGADLLLLPPSPTEEGPRG